jgi:endo-1,4-beta-xylanase
MAKFKKSRRRLIAAIAAAGALSLLDNAQAASVEDDSRSLRSRAERRGMFFGCGVSARDVQADPQLCAAIVADCSVIVPTVEMKWGWIEPREGQENFADADALVNFAAQNGLKVRGHTAIWYTNVPKWAPMALRGNDGAAIFETHIRSVLDHFGGRIINWDIVNEALWLQDGLPGGFRNSIFQQVFGSQYIERAYEIAREALPRTPLFYNDFGVEYADHFHSEKRAATLQLLTRLKRRGLVDGFGIQSHLHVGWGFDAKLFQRFLSDVADLGLEILLTEFDVNDVKAPADIAARDAAIAVHAREYLDVALAERAVKGLLAWGLSDRGTWLNAPPYARSDGLGNRGQPLDQALQKKALWHAIAGALDAAPGRSPR